MFKRILLNTQIVCSFVTVLLTCILLVTPVVYAQTANKGVNPLHAIDSKLTLILERLNEIEEKQNKVEESLTAMSGEQVAATFCIAQGREIGLGAGWAATSATEWEAGIGWAEVFSGEGTVEVKIPAGPIPSEVGINLAGSHGRNFNICVTLPVELGSTDTALLAELARDINKKADNFPNRGKFQRRAHRLLNFTKVRVPGIDTREFDRIDTAVQAIYTGGLHADGSALSVFQNAHIQDFVQAYGGLPNNIESIVNDPAQLWDPLSKIGENGLDNIDCAALGMDQTIRNQKPGFDKLCDRLETLPDFTQVKNVLTGEFMAPILEAIDNLEIVNNASEVAETTKNNFCGSWAGHWWWFDNYCGR